jgi:hypothetical protein
VYCVERYRGKAKNLSAMLRLIIAAGHYLWVTADHWAGGASTLTGPKKDHRRSGGVIRANPQASGAISESETGQETNKKAPRIRGIIGAIGRAGLCSQGDSLGPRWAEPFSGTNDPETLLLNALSELANRSPKTIMRALTVLECAAASVGDPDLSERIFLARTRCGLTAGRAPTPTPEASQAEVG